MRLRLAELLARHRHPQPQALADFVACAAEHGDVLLVAGNLIGVNVIEDPRYRVADDALG